MNQTQPIALKWLERGIGCLPLQPNSKYLLKGTRLSEPMSLNPFDAIIKFGNPKYNLAVMPDYSEVTQKYLVVLDFDDTTDFWKWHNGLVTLATFTRRGLHCYFWVEEEPTGLVSDICEVKYQKPVTAPPSCVKGFEYRDNGEAVMTVDRLSDVIEVGSSPSKKENEQHITVNIYDNHGTINIGDNISSLTRGKSCNVPASVIKQQYSIARLFIPASEPNNGMTLAHCPGSAHENGDRNPSLSLDLSTNRCNCFKPGCEFHGSRGFSNIDAYMKIHGLSFHQALTAMSEELGI